MFESIPNYRKIVLIIFLIKNDKIFLKEVGCRENDNNRLILEFKILLIEHEE